MKSTIVVGMLSVFTTLRRWAIDVAANEVMKEMVLIAQPAVRNQKLPFCFEGLILYCKIL